jgi:hypothetical protein
MLTVVLCDFTFAYARDCEPLKLEQPINSEISNQIKANANVLFRQLGSGEFENSSKKTQEDLQSRYPNADRVEIWRSFIYFECTLLKSSHLSDQEKQTKFAALMDAYRNSSPPSNSFAATPNATETTAVENLKVPIEKPNDILLGGQKTKEWAIVYQELGHVVRSSELATQGRTNLDDAYNGLVQEGLNRVGIFTNNTLDFVLIYGYGTRLEALSHLEEFRNKRTSLGSPSNVGVINLRSICPSGVFVPNKIEDYVCR